MTPDPSTSLETRLARAEEAIDLIAQFVAGSTNINRIGRHLALGAEGLRLLALLAEIRAETEEREVHV